MSSALESRFSAPSRRCQHPEYWTSDDEDATENEVARLVYGLVRGLQPDYCVETGTWHGTVAEAVGEALSENGHGRLSTIEVDEDAAAAARLRLNIESVEVVLADSLQWTPAETVDFAWLDSSRVWDHRLAEFDRFLPYMRAGTVVCFHDTNSGSPFQAAVGERLRKDNTARYIHLPTPRGLTVAEIL